MNVQIQTKISMTFLRHMVFSQQWKSINLFVFPSVVKHGRAVCTSISWTLLICAFALSSCQTANICEVCSRDGHSCGHRVLLGMVPTQNRKKVCYCDACSCGFSDLLVT